MNVLLRPALTRLRRAALAAPVLAAAAVLVLSAAATAQETGGRGERPDVALERRLDEVREARRQGDLAETIRLVDEVLEDYPDNQRVFWLAATIYRSAGAVRERLIPLLERRVSAVPDDLRAREDLGEAYAAIGEFERAHEIWMTFLRAGAPSRKRYSRVGALEMNLGMYSYAITTFLEARDRFGEPALFAEELAASYTSVGEYEKALEESFAAVRDHPGLTQWAVNRALLMLEEGAPRRLVLEVLDRRAEQSNVTAYELGVVGGVHLAIGEGDEALEAFLRADELAGGIGTQLFGFAHLLVDGGQYAEAREAFLMVAERHPGSVQTPAARIAAAGLLSDLGEPGAAAAELKEVARALEKDDDVAEAVIRAAAIELREIDDPAGALTTLEALEPVLARLTEGGSAAPAEAAALRIDAALALGDFHEASDWVERLLTLNPRGAVRERALFQEAYLRFLRGENGEAMALFRRMVEGDAGGALVNDALRLMLVISGGEDDPESVALLAAGHAAAVSGDEARAVDSIERLAREHPGTPAAAEGLMLLGGMAEERDDPDRALEIYARVFEETESLAARAEAIMRRGDIYESRVARPDLALEEYERLLDELPQNFLSGEARRNIEALRRKGVIAG